MAKLTEFETLENKYKANSNSIVFAQYAEALVSQGKESDAVEVLATGLEHFPDYVTAYMVLAQAMRLEGNLQQAERHLKKVLELDDRCLGALKNLAEISKEQSKIKEAIEYYEILLDLCPNHSMGKKAYRLLVESDDSASGYESESTTQDLESAENMMDGDDDLSTLGEELLGKSSASGEGEDNMDVVAVDDDIIDSNSNRENITNHSDFGNDEDLMQSPEIEEAIDEDVSIGESSGDLTSENIPAGEDLDSKWDELEQNSESDSSLGNSLSDIENGISDTSLTTDTDMYSDVGDTMVLDHPVQKEISEIESAELESTELESTELESAELESTELESAELESAELESSDFEESESATPGSDDVLDALDSLDSDSPNTYTEPVIEVSPDGDDVLEALDDFESKTSGMDDTDVSEISGDDVENAFDNLAGADETENTLLETDHEILQEPTSTTVQSTDKEELTGEFDGFGDEVENIFDSMEDEKSDKKPEHEPIESLAPSSDDSSNPATNATPPFMLNDEEATVFLSQDDLIKAEEESKKQTEEFETSVDVAKLEDADVEELSPLSIDFEEDEESEAGSNLSATPNTATVTLAEIYFKQGLKEQSLDIYRQLAQREPENELIKKRIEEIEQSQINDSTGPANYEEERRKTPRPGIKIKKRRR